MRMRRFELCWTIDRRKEKKVREKFIIARVIDALDLIRLRLSLSDKASKLKGDPPSFNINCTNFS